LLNQTLTGTAAPALEGNVSTNPPPPSSGDEHVNLIENVKTGHEAEEIQQSESMKIFFILIVLG